MADKKNEKIVILFLRQIEKNLSLTNCCIRFIYSYRFLSSSLDSIVKTFVDDKQKVPKIVEKELDGKGNIILKIVHKLETVLVKLELLKTFKTFSSRIG